MAIETVGGSQSVQTLGPDRKAMSTQIDYTEILAGKARKDAALRVRLEKSPSTPSPFPTAEDLLYDNFALAIIAIKRFCRTLPERVINIIPPRPRQ